MVPKRSLVVTVLAALLLAPAATAKELQAVVVCGVSACERFDDPRLLRDVPQGGETEEPLGPPAAYYRVTFVHGEPPNSHEEQLTYRPGQNALVFVDEYGTARALPIFGSTATGIMRRLTRGLEPFPPPVVSADDDGLALPAPWPALLAALVLVAAAFAVLRLRARGGPGAAAPARR